MKFKGIEVVQSERNSVGNEDFWVPVNGPAAIHTIHDPTEPGFEDAHWYELHHEAGHVETLFRGSDEEVLQRMQVVLQGNKKKFIHPSSLIELDADLYALWAWIEGTELEKPYLANTARQTQSYDHNLARRLFFNILETGEVFGPEADISKLKGEYAIVGPTEVGKSSLVNFLLGEEAARVVNYSNPEPTSEVSRHERDGLILWDTPPLYDGRLKDVGNTPELEEMTTQFLEDHPNIDLIYAIFPNRTNGERQAETFKRISGKGNVKQVVLTRGDESICLDGKFVHDYGNQLSGQPVTISTITGEGMYKLIENLMK